MTARKPAHLVDRAARWRGKVPIPKKAHPLVRQLFKMMNADGITLRELAEMSGVGVKTLSDWRYRRAPTLALFIAAANALGMEVVMRPDITSGQSAKAAEIKRLVADALGYDEDGFCRKYGGHAVTRPAQIAMWAVRRAFPSMSLTDLGREFGDREHSTVRHSLDRGQAFIERSDWLRGQVDSIIKSVGAEP